MLILTRKGGESIEIYRGNVQIHVTVLEVKGRQVRLGIKAPKSHQIHRSEVLARIQAENLKKEPA